MSGEQYNFAAAAHFLDCLSFISTQYEVDDPFHRPPPSEADAVGLLFFDAR